MTNIVILTIFLVCLVLFFWGAYKAAKTHKKIYLLAFMPFMFFIIGMFLL